MQLARTALAALLGITLLTAGCGGAPLRRPAPPPRPGAAATPAPPVTPGGTMQPSPGARKEGSVIYPSPRAGSAYDDPATGVATVAGAVPGAGAVHAVVLGNVAILGTTNTDPAVHRKVAEQIRSSFQHITDIRFTTDHRHIMRLIEAEGRIHAHQSISQLLPELAAIGGSLPSVR